MKENIHCVKCGGVIGNEEFMYIESTKHECPKCKIWFYVDGIGELENGK